MSAEQLPWRDEYLLEHFQRFDRLLQRYLPLWREQAFQQPQLPWEQQFPGLASSLRNMEFTDAERLAENANELAQRLSEFVPDAITIYNACQLSPLSAGELPQLAEGYTVPGRKWQQINAFAACVPNRDAPLLEWCAGKAHLGRFLASVQRRVVAALEWNAELVAAGTELAQRENLAVHMHCVDVLAPVGASFISREHDVMALHACGQLHVQLLKSCATQQPQIITLAPCCYHLGADARYQALSRSATDSRLQLTMADLHTAVRDSVTSPQRVQLQRKKLQAWRLGFDLWQRETRGIDSYLATPSRPLSVLKAGFVTFCQELSALNAIEAPTAARCEYYERMGWQRLQAVAGLDLARMLFRRPLELWLLLDRALFLREHGYRVELGTFCERQLTPRNVLLRAQRL
jgi:hypothetical protein